MKRRIHVLEPNMLSRWSKEGRLSVQAEEASLNVAAE